MLRAASAAAALVAAVRMPAAVCARAFCKRADTVSVRVFDSILSVSEGCHC